VHGASNLLMLFKNYVGIEAHILFFQIKALNQLS